MALAKSCDRCGVLYPGYNDKHNGEKTNGFMLLNLDCYGKYYTNKTHDLCPDCMKSFRKWLAND